MRSSLVPEIVSAGLVTSDQPWSGLEFHPAIGSTNTRLRELLTRPADAAGPLDGTAHPAYGALWWVVLTDHQTGGRGRLGRAWEVPDRAAVAVSAAVPVTGPQGAGWLPLAAGVALARTLREVSREAGHELTPRLKWPNDVLLADDGDRKVSGILCELVAFAPTEAAVASEQQRATDPPRYAVVVGTGVNVGQTREELPVDTATSLALAGVDVSRETLVVRYLRELAGLLGARPSAAPDATGASGSAGRPWDAVDLAGLAAGPAAAAYRAECWTLGQRIRVHLPTGATVEGEAVSVDDDGALVVATDHGTRSLAAGDVVHVRRP